MPTVVLIHGLFGFRRFLWFDYFKGVRPLLEGMGVRVLVPELPWAGTIEQRSARLAAQLADETGPLHLVGHSMGGVDARAFISRLGGAAKVASLTTLATPHHGSPAADYVCSGASLFRLFAGVRALTREQLRTFNQDTPDADSIIYRSYAAARPLTELPWIVRRYGRFIEREEGANDAQVSAVSAAWGDLVATLYADHFELIGLNLWLNPLRKRAAFDHLPLYREIGSWVLAYEASINQSR